MKKLKLTVVAFLMATLLTGAFAQGEKQSLFDFGVEFKSSHVWRGLSVSDQALLDANIRLTDRNKNFALGLWASSSLTSGYREFNYYVGYYRSGFSLEVWDINNFHGNSDADMFDYRAKSTNRFFDVSVAYQLQGACPLKFYWATIVHGSPNINTEGKKNYPTYVQVSCPILQDGPVNLGAGIGGAFALVGKETLYGPKPGVVDVNLTASKDLKLGNYTLPVSVTAFWNPLLRKTYYTIAVQLVQF